jgi:hypothetical protein
MHDYSGWLEAAAPDLTDEERKDFVTAANAYYTLPAIARRSGDDIAAAADDHCALTAILQLIRGEESLAAIASSAREAQARLNAWVRASAALGVPEGEIAELTQLSLPAVRARLGK